VNTVLPTGRAAIAWLGIDGTWFTGGRTTINGAKGDDLQRNARIGGTLALPVNRQQSVKLSATTGVVTRVGTNFDIVGIAWQYRWGGGL
jgi:hypothetical protein